jgi:hypothetical protein
MLHEPSLTKSLGLSIFCTDYIQQLIRDLSTVE